MAAMGYGTPLGQLGQGWWHQTGGSAQYGDQGIPGAMGGGVGQTGNWMQDTGPMAGDAGQPVGGTSIPGYGLPGSPVTNDGGVSATGPFMQNNMASAPSDPGGGTAAAGVPAGGTPSPGLARAPASGPPLGYGQPSFMMGRSFNPGGFGGIGTRGQGSGAPFWARLNNIGGR